MTRACGKRRYRDELAAKLALATVQRQDKTKRPKTEARVYRCDQCKAWHLTSKETR